MGHIPFIRRASMKLFTASAGRSDTALRLARYFRMSPQFRLGLQTDYDSDVAEDLLGEQLDHEIVVIPA